NVNNIDWHHHIYSILSVSVGKSEAESDLLFLFPDGSCRLFYFQQFTTLIDDYLESDHDHIHTGIVGEALFLQFYKLLIAVFELFADHRERENVVLTAKFCYLLGEDILVTFNTLG